LIIMTNSGKNGSGPARREVKLHCFNCLRSELDKFEQAGEDGLTTTGEWTAGQIVQHVCETMKRSIDGFEFKAPWFVRLMRPIIRMKFVGKAKPIPAGIKLTGDSTTMIPPKSVALSDAIADLRSTIERAKKEKMAQPSPVFGKMTHEDWVNLHLRHAELHFSFIRLPNGSAL